MKLTFPTKNNKKSLLKKSCLKKVHSLPYFTTFSNVNAVENLNVTRIVSHMKKKILVLWFLFPFGCCPPNRPFNARDRTFTIDVPLLLLLHGTKRKTCLIQLEQDGRDTSALLAGKMRDAAPTVVSFQAKKESTTLLLFLRAV